MNWKDVRRDGPPGDQMEVLLLVSGVYHLARYDAGDELFRLRDQIGVHFRIGEGGSMFWCELGGPDGERRP